MFICDVFEQFTICKMSACAVNITRQSNTYRHMRPRHFVTYSLYTSHRSTQISIIFQVNTQSKSCLPMLIQCVNSVACFLTSYGLSFLVNPCKNQCLTASCLQCMSYVVILMPLLWRVNSVCRPICLELFIAQRCIDRFGSADATLVCVNVR